MSYCAPRNLSRMGRDRMVHRGRHLAILRSRILILPSKTELLDRSLDELFEPLEGCWFIRKQVQVCCNVFRDLDATIVDPIINPMRGNVKSFGDLCESECSSNMTGMGLAPHLEQPVSQANDFDSTW